MRSYNDVSKLQIWGGGAYLVRVHETAAGIRKRLHQAFVCDIFFRSTGSGFAVLEGLCGLDEENRLGEEDWDCLCEETDRRPRVLEQQVLFFLHFSMHAAKKKTTILTKHVEPDACVEDVVDLAYKVEVAGIERSQLDILAAVEGNLLCVGDDTAVRKAELALECSLVGTELAKVGCDETHEVERRVVGPPQGANTGLTHVALELAAKEPQVKRRLAQVAVELCQRLGKLVDVGGDESVFFFFPIDFEQVAPRCYLNTGRRSRCANQG